jgi:predicted N-acetyltransferase YhbS
MPRLETASHDQVETVYRESYAIWGGGLAFEEYFGLWLELSGLQWCRRNAGFRVWIDDGGAVLSSLKLYHPLLQVLGRTARATVLGAIYTPLARRGRGHASDMLEAVIEECRERGEPAAMLFSDIGTTFYETFGFRALPAEEQWGRIPRAARGIPEGWELRDSEEADMPAIMQAHSDRAVGRPLAFIRDEEHWRFLQARSAGYFSRLRDPAVRQRSRTALRNGRFAGYLITVEGRGEWNIREVGAAGGDPAGMATIIRLGAHEARRAGARRLYGWLPPEVVELLDDWPLKVRLRDKACPMILSLDERVDVDRLLTVRAAYLPYQDQF